MDVAYSRVMFLGTAGVGKTCLRKSLMKERWDSSSINSTLVSDVHSVRPVGYQWQSLGRDADNEWREVTEEDEIQEMAELLAAVHNHHDGEGFKSKMSAMQLFKDDQSSLTAEVSKEKVEEFERTHVQSFFSKAMNRAQVIRSSHITPQPFVHLWDCGGQPVFLEILPAFLTSRTMFLLIYDASKSFHDQWKSVQTVRGERRKEEEVNMTTLDHIHSWLSNIHIHLAKHDSDGGLLDYPRVLSIGTHGDKVGDHDATIKELKSHFKGKPFEALIDGFYIVDNTTAGTSKEDANFSEIRKKIFDFTSNKLIVKTPISWVLFRKVIEIYEANVISLEEAQAIGVACKIPAEVVPKVLLFYHDLGVVLFYPHIRGLHDKVIIDSKWFVGVLGKVLTLEGRDEYKTRLMWDLLQEKGILVQPLYVAAWKEVRDIHPEALIELLVHFHLAAKVTTDEYHDLDVKQYFLPLVLPSYDDKEKPLSGYLRRATPLHLTFRTEFVPPGFFTRLVTILAESSKCKIRFEKGVYRDKIHIYYGDDLRDDVILMELPHAIQVEIFRYCPENEFLSEFTNVCQMLRKDLIKMSTTVDRCLFYSKNKCKIFKGIQFLCAACPADDPHYLLNTKQTSGLYVNCDRDDKYRQLTTEEALWFPSKMNKEFSNHLEDREFLQISQKIPDQDSLFRLAAVLNMTSELRRIQADDSKRNLAGFNLLYDWQIAKDGYRSQLVEALKESSLLKLAQMVQQCEYDPVILESNNGHLSFESSFIVAETFVDDAFPPTIQPAVVPILSVKDAGFHMIPSIAGEKIFPIQGDYPQVLNWEEYGLQIGIPKEALKSSETAEIAVKALVGGQFKFPKRTQLVSAVYTISVSKPLVKPLRLDMQHCVNITRPSQINYLKFVIASIDTPSLPYQFEVLEGGEFTVNSVYGSIHHQTFSCLAIVLNEVDTLPDPTPTSDEDKKEDPYKHEEEGNGSTNSCNKESNGYNINDESTQSNESQTHGASGSAVWVKDSCERKEEVKTKLSQEPTIDVSGRIRYAGVIFHEDDNLFIFSATKNLNALLKYIKDEYPQAKKGQPIHFCFQPHSEYITLKFDTKQKKLCTGWIVEPHMEPCHLYLIDINNFGTEEHPIPPSCLISVYSINSPDTVPVLHYGIPLEGVDRPVTIFIHRELNTTNTGTPLEVPPSSSGTQSTPSTKVTQSQSLPTSSGHGAQSTKEQLRQIIDEFLVSRHADLNGLPDHEESLQELANHLFASELIGNAVNKNPTMDKCISEFKASLRWLKDQSAIQNHCSKFLSAFKAVRGSYSTAADSLCEDLIKAVNDKLKCNFSIELS